MPVALGSFNKLIRQQRGCTGPVGTSGYNNNFHFAPPLYSLIISYRY